MAKLFSLYTTTPSPPTYREVVAAYHETFTQRIAEGTLRPLIIPYHFYGAFTLLAYLCLPQANRLWLYNARWFVLGFIYWWQWKMLRESSSMSMATAFAVGLFSAWIAVLSTTWLVWRRPQLDAKRLERRRLKSPTKEALDEETTSNHANTDRISGKGARPATSQDTSSMRKRLVAQSNGHTSGAKNESRSASQSSKTPSNDEEWEYYWQPFPDNFPDRFCWVGDLLANFRGPGWNWAISSLPPPPPFVLSKLGSSIPPASISGTSSTGLRRFDTRRSLIQYRVPQFVAGYFLLDAMKTVMMKDPYFIFGPNIYARPEHLFVLSSTVLQFYRQTVSGGAIILSLEMVFMLAPLGCSVLLGPNILGLRGEPWYYPTTWGSLGQILDKGLTGLWGNWWHQTFRFIFSSPANYFITNGYVKPKSTAARILALGFAFGISGILHSAGSICQLPKTFPWHAPIFFMLQATGIILQMTACSAFKPIIKQLPVFLRRLGNVVFALAWLYSTSPWLSDDFARGGIWLYEPIPISLFRALGFGVQGDSWWCWQHVGISWYAGNHWWESGIAI